MASTTYRSHHVWQPAVGALACARRLLAHSRGAGWAMLAIEVSVVVWRRLAFFCAEPRRGQAPPGELGRSLAGPRRRPATQRFGREARAGHLQRAGPEARSGLRRSGGSDESQLATCDCSNGCGCRVAASTEARSHRLKLWRFDVFGRQVVQSPAMYLVNPEGGGQNTASFPRTQLR